MNTAFRYIGYCVVSLLLGWLSSLGGEKDILQSISNNLFQLLITIIVLYITLSNLVYNQIILIKSKNGEDVSSGVSALKRNIKIMFSIIGIDFISFVLLNIFPSTFYSQAKSLFFLFDKQVAINALTFFSVFYFLYVIYDSAMAFYNLIKFNSNSEQNK